MFPDFSLPDIINAGGLPMGHAHREQNLAEERGGMSSEFPHPHMADELPLCSYLGDETLEIGMDERLDEMEHGLETVVGLTHLQGVKK